MPLPFSTSTEVFLGAGAVCAGFSFVPSAAAFAADDSAPSGWVNW